MKVEFTKTVKEKVTEDVEFPIYSKHNFGLDHADIIDYCCIEDNMTEYSVKTEQEYGRNKSISVELKIDKANFNDGSGPDYWLGRGSYASSCAEFEEAVRKAESILKTIKRGRSEKTEDA